MLLVKTYLGKSSIDGIGLFAAEPIKKGTPTWVFNSNTDKLLSPDELNDLPSHIREYVEKYSYLSKISGLYVLCGDDSKFMNHSDNPTTSGAYSRRFHPEGIDVAIKDLEVGEELTCNYRTFEKRQLDWLKE